MKSDGSLNRIDRRTFYRAAKKVLTQQILPRWHGTRSSLDRIVRAVLRGRRTDFLRKLVRVQAFAATMAALVLASPASADPIELSSLAVPENSSGFMMNGEISSDEAGKSVSDAGDVNGDGLADVIIGAPRADVTFYTEIGIPFGEEGKSYVVFGKTSGGEFNLADIEAGAGGFVIIGESPDDYSGCSVSGAGDVNGDGKDDLIVGADQSYYNSVKPGKAYVVFGKSSGAAVQLANVAAGTGGFAINGAAAADRAGGSVSGAGDVNSDGKDDVIVGAQLADPNGNLSGQSYVVFGKTNTTAVELSDIVAGTGGFAISGEDANDRSGFSVSGAGDVNGDGRDDVIVGAHGASVDFYAYEGKAYVVFGKTSGTTVELSVVAAGTGGGFVMNGETPDIVGDRAGYSVSGAGDVNGDGKDDVIVGAQNATSPGIYSGRSYVVFGKSTATAVDLTTVAAGTGGFAINAEAAGDHSGNSVSGAGDVDGDGRDDLLVGARFASTPFLTKCGKAYVVYGKTTGTAVALADVVASDLGGFAMNGEAIVDYAGTSVSIAGDVNGDGAGDLMVGSYRHNVGAIGDDHGRGYVVFSPFPNGGKVWVDFADPGAQTGTFDDPFNQVADAVTAVAEGGTIVIKGTGSNVETAETGIISKKLTIESTGESIRIGVP